jgi:PAS domain-containing protein
MGGLYKLPERPAALSNDRYSGWRHVSCSVRCMRSVGDVPAMLWLARPDMSCEYRSRQWREFTGTPIEDPRELWADGVHPEDLARWLNTCLRAFDSRAPYEVHYRLRRRDGQYRWILERAVPRFDAHGAFAGYAGACIEIEPEPST